MRICRFVLAVLMLCATGSMAQFEGTVRMVAVSQPEEDSTVVLSTVYFKGNLLAAVIEADETAGQQGSRFILRGDRHVMWIVLEEEQKVIEIPIGGEAAGGAVPAKKNYSLERTGKTATVAGFACEEWRADEGGGKFSRIWTTGELGDLYRGVVKWFDEMSMENATPGNRWEHEIAESGLFPVRILRFDDDELTESEEVLSVEKGNVPASTFEFPPGFERQALNLDFENMFDEMMKKMEADSGARGGDRDDDPADDPGAGPR